MAHSINDELTRERILELLRKLDTKMFERGIEANIYIVGGAAIALTLNEERVTTDVDAKYDNLSINPLINEIAAEEDLTTHWFNDSFKSILSYFKKDDEPKTLFVGKNLAVMVASPDFVLAMKLAARRDKDVTDVVMLINKLGIKNREELIEATKRYFMADLSAAAHQRVQIEEFIDRIIEEGLLEFPS